ncbi:hypothetical protein BJY52DRAFT_1216412 [Lactarius psammicola]|nr:hypothetical protein BJY52DRAFT_1216412 [Lactarius psammicola]
MDPSTFPNPVPSGTRVQQWALQDITRVNLWNVTTALTIGDTPEILPGDLIGTSASSSDGTTSSTSTSAPTSTSPAPTSSGSGSNTWRHPMAAIAGLVFIFWRRRRRPQAPSAAFVAKGASPPPSSPQMSKVHPGPPYDHTPGPHMTLYDPSNPSTYPQREEGVPTSTPDVNVPVVSYDGYLSGNNPTNMQPLRPQGYHGLPTV